MSSSLCGVTFTARVAFSRRSFSYLEAIVLPWLLCAGQRCVTRLRALAPHRRSLSGYYRFLSEGRFRLDLFFDSLLRLVLATFPTRSLVLVLDDTLCPKWGRRIFGVAPHYDAARQPFPGVIYGHDWVVLAVVVRLGALSVALPVWIRLYRSAATCPKAKFRTRVQLAVEGLERIRACVSGPIRLLADGAYNNASLIDELDRLDITLVSRLRSNARLRSPTPARRPTRRPGRPSRYGAWLARLPRLACHEEGFLRRQVSMYGHQVSLELFELVAYWPALGRAIKVVITRDPARPGRVAFLSTTDLGLDAVEVVEAFAQRWSIEQLFSVLKEQLGLESAEVRSERSVLRHAALSIALATWVEVWARRSRPALSAKPFAAKLAALREEAVRDAIFASGPRTRRTDQIARDFAHVLSTATRAA